MQRARKLGGRSRQSVVIWGFVNRLPRQLMDGQSFRDSRIEGAFVQDASHFLLMLHHHELKACLQELVIYHGNELRGLLQIFPTMGAGGGMSMGDSLCRVIYHEARFPMDRLRIRFYAVPYQVIFPRERDRQGLLTFDVAEFLSVLEMAAVFRTVLRPEEQKVLYELLMVSDPAEEQFYWGRFVGYLGQEAKDMLSAWNIRQWSKDRIKLLYELTDYVAYYQSDQSDSLSGGVEG